MAGFISDAQAKALSQEAEASIWSNDGQSANAVQGSKEQPFTIQPHPASHHAISTPVKLPVDVIQHLIEAVDVHGGDFRADAEDRRSLLAACSLVCRAWNDICRHVIFRKISFRERFFLISRLCFFRDKAHHLTKYVKETDISFENDFNLSVPRIHGWLSECFDKFENLTVLHLVNHEDSYCICYGRCTAESSICSPMLVFGSSIYITGCSKLRLPSQLARMQLPHHLGKPIAQKHQDDGEGSPSIGPAHLEELRNLEVYDYKDIFYGPGRSSSARISKHVLSTIGPFHRGLQRVGYPSSLYATHPRSRPSSPALTAHLLPRLRCRPSPLPRLRTVIASPPSFYKNFKVERIQISVELDFCAVKDWLYSASAGSVEVARLEDAFDPLLKEGVLFIEFSVRDILPEGEKERSCDVVYRTEVLRADTITFLFDIAHGPSTIYFTTWYFDSPFCAVRLGGLA
ncbi:hypothetical protein IMY05_C4466000100 [Salix suchowensis]|nr:hypothetical protein IMY05_C4466000100 [Salix suchowensis]